MFGFLVFARGCCVFAVCGDSFNSCGCVGFAREFSVCAIVTLTCRL